MNISVLTGVLRILCVCIFFAGFSAFGQPSQNIKIYKNPETTEPIPVALNGFTGEVQSVLRFDLEVAGFKVTNSDAAEIIVSGNNNGDVEGEVVDGLSKAVLLPRARYQGGSPRFQAHTFADEIVERITGKKGIARSKIIFRGDSGNKTEIYYADYDGANPKQITQDNTLVAAPVWVPGRRAMFYTSYMSGYPDIWYHDLTTGQRKPFAKFPGLNTSAAVSPDGRKVAMILSKGGSPDLYVADIEGTNFKRLTSTKEDESSPCWSPDGSTICYVSSSSGTPSLYTISAAGGAPKRIRTAGASKVTEPDWSPDGKFIAFTAMWGTFQICKVSAQGGEIQILADGEDPTWAVNSRTIIFSRKVNGKRTLSLLDAQTKRVKDVPQTLGGCSQPSWAK